MKKTIFGVLLIAVMCNTALIGQPICDLRVFDSAGVLTGPENLQLTTLAKILMQKGVDVRVITILNKPESSSLEETASTLIFKPCNLEGSNSVILIYAKNTNSFSLLTEGKAKILESTEARNAIREGFENGKASGESKGFEMAMREIENRLPVITSQKITENKQTERDAVPTVAEPWKPHYPTLHIPRTLTLTMIGITLTLLICFIALRFGKFLFDYIERRSQFDMTMNLIREKRLELMSGYSNIHSTFSIFSAFSPEEFKNSNLEHKYREKIGEARRRVRELDERYAEIMSRRFQVPSLVETTEIADAYERAFEPLEESKLIRDQAEEKLGEITERILNQP